MTLDVNYEGGNGVMARRGRATKFGDLLPMTLLGGAIYYGYGPRLSSLSWVLLAVAVLMVWVCFFMPTHCDYQTLRSTPCTRWVRGKLRGCRSHGRLKRDAVFAVIKLRNPGLLFRVMWSAPTTPAAPRAMPTVAATSPSSPVPPSKQAANEVAMLVFTVVSAVAAVLALFK